MIIENKIHGAVDQDEQLVRYIEEEKAYIGCYDKIFVIYLTRSGGAPSDNSLPDKHRSGGHYKEIDYENHILPWLSDKVRPIVNEYEEKDINDRYTILQTALDQYINHLEGMFYQRKGEETMKQELMEFISTELYKDNYSELQFFNELQKNEEIAKKFIEIIDLKKYEIINKKIFSLKDKLTKKEELKVSNISELYDFGTAGSTILYSIPNWPDRYCIGISFVTEYTNLFLGIQDRKGNWKRNDNKLIKELQEISILKNSQETNNLWLYGKYIVKGDTLDFLHWDEIKSNKQALIYEINRIAEDGQITKLLKEK